MATKERKKEATPQKPFGLDVDRSRTSPGHSFSKAMLGTRYGVRWLLLFIIRCFTGNCLDDSRQNEPLAREIIALCHDLNSRDDSFLPPLVKVFALSDVITFWESCPTSTAISPLVSLLDILELDNPIAFNKIKQQILAEIAGGMTFKKAMANKKKSSISFANWRGFFSRSTSFSAIRTGFSANHLKVHLARSIRAVSSSRTSSPRKLRASLITSSTTPTAPRCQSAGAKWRGTSATLLLRS